VIIVRLPALNCLTYNLVDNPHSSNKQLLISFEYYNLALHIISLQIAFLKDYDTQIG